MFTTASISQPLQTVPYVDLKKYAGKWYEIASFPQRFQKGCNFTTAEYTLTGKGFDHEKLDEVLQLREKCLRSSVLLAFGYRDIKNDYLVNLKK